jgi:hypothetical protein
VAGVKDPVVAAVAATLRHVAEWGLAFDNGPARSELMDLARQVEALEQADDFCCPVCEEVVCDDGCPLAEVRRRFQERS